MVSWTAFSEAYASIMLTLFVPLTLAALGIVLRGASFAFRKSVVTLRDRRLFGAAFALSSVLVPYCMGAVAGGIASGRVPAGGEAGDPVDSWINPTSVVTGVLAVGWSPTSPRSTWSGRPAARTTPSWSEYFRRRAVVAGGRGRRAGAVGMVVLHDDAPYVFDGMTGRALPVVLVGVALRRRRAGPAARDAARGARVLAVLAVAGLVVAWGVAQWPYLLPESLTVSDAAAPPAP